MKYPYYRMQYRRLSSRNNVAIPPYCFEKGLMITHLQNIVVSKKVRVGMFCRLFHNTTIGIKLGEPGPNNCPSIGNYVTISVGACILGGISVADKTTVGAGAILLSDVVNEDTVVVGVPGRAIKNNTQWSMYDFVMRTVGKKDI